MMVRPDSITLRRKTVGNKPVWIGGVFMSKNAVPITVAFDVRAKANCWNCGELFELNLGKTSVEESPTPDSEPIRAEFSFPVACPMCDVVFAGVKFEDEDATD